MKIFSSTYHDKHFMKQTRENVTKITIRTTLVVTRLQFYSKIFHFRNNDFGRIAPSYILIMHPCLFWTPTNADAMTTYKHGLDQLDQRINNGHINSDDTTWLPSF